MKVLFLCSWNAIRSPMAAALLLQRFPDWHVASAGVFAQEIDPFVVAVMAEDGIDLANHEPREIGELDHTMVWDIVIVLSDEAEAASQHLLSGQCEHWPLTTPQVAGYSREQRLDVYRTLRQNLQTAIDERFKD